MRTLQLKRFDRVFSTREVAIENINTQAPNLKDGEPIVAAYYKDQEHTEIAYVIGLKVEKEGGVSSMFTMDAADLEEKIESLSGTIESGLTYMSSVTQVTAATYTSATTDTYKNNTNSPDSDSEFRIMFTPVVSDTSTVPVSIGDIKAGTTAAQLKQYSVSKILDDIIFKTIYPTITRNPSATITLSQTGIIDLSTGTTGGASVNITTTYTNGQAKLMIDDAEPTGNTSAAYTGTVVVSGAQSGTVTGPSYTGMTEPGTYTFKLTAAYGEGNLLHDSKGGTGETGQIDVFTSATATATTKQANPHAAGSVTAQTSARTTFATYVNSGATYSEAVSKLPIKAWGAATWMEISRSDVTDVQPLLIEVPSGRTLAKVAVLNPNKPATAETSYDTILYQAGATGTQKIVSNGTTSRAGRTYNKYKSANGATFAGNFQYLIKIN